MSTIALIAAGAMGASVGRKFVEAGHTVLTSLEGRSNATRKRAEEAGMIDAPWSDIILKADILLSIIPPGDAISFARLFLREYHSVKRLGENPIIFADCNAVNPDTVKKMATLFSDTSVIFLDACIIGGPPSGTYVPRFYACADSKYQLELKQFQAAVGAAGIKIKALDGEGSGIGDASALKMSYAGISKGLTGLFTTIILAAYANSSATSEALLQELADSQPELLKRITRAVPSMIPKAYRWVAEMEEIAGFIAGDEREIYRGMANVYSRVDKSLTEGNDDVDTLKEFVAKAKSRV